jgi:hypothetical protein
LKKLAFAVGALAPALVAPAAADTTPINVEKWPDDIPCSALKKNADGSYEITVPFARFSQIHNGAKYKNTRETHYWDGKCKGQTQ